MSTAVEDHEQEPLDIRAMPIDNQTGDQTWKDTVVKQCICGCDQFWVLTKFDDDGSIGGYFLDIICAMCGSWYKAPTPEDDNLVLP